MKATSALYKSLLADKNHATEIKAVIAGREYGQDRIASCCVSGGLFAESGWSIGGAVARELQLKLAPLGDIPRMGEIRLYLRLTLGGRASEWLPAGVFYIDTRAEEAVSHMLTLHGYDAMLKAEAVWLDPTQDAGEWPMAMRTAVNRIAARMGVEVDPRTSILPYTVEYPNDYTMREALGFIAAAHGGNFIITAAGRLLLHTTAALPAETNFLVESETGGAILLGEVRLLV